LMRHGSKNKSRDCLSVCYRQCMVLALLMVGVVSEQITSLDSELHAPSFSL